jgi:hypothetical protein
MIPDPIVEEVRAIRDEIAQECNYDIDTIFEALRHLAVTSSAQHVSLPPRKTGEADQQESALASGAASP